MRYVTYSCLKFVQISNFSDEAMYEERERLCKVDSLEVLDYIKQSVEILMNMKGEEYEQFVKNKEIHDKLQLKEEKKRLKEIISKDKKEKKEVKKPKNDGRNLMGPSRFILSSSMLTGSSMQMSVDNDTKRPNQSKKNEEEAQLAVTRPYEKQIQKLENDFRTHIRVE